MLTALPQPFEIEQTGTSFLESLAGPALIALAAIVAAFVAAWVARRNHAAQLANDRGLRDLDHARQTISAAFETVAKAIDDVGIFEAKARAVSNAREEVELAMAEADEALPTYSRTEDGALFDTRDVPEEEAVGLEHREMETDAVEAETAALRKKTKAMQDIGDTRKVAEGVGARLIADGFRLRINIGLDSDVVKKHKAFADAVSAWLDSLRPDESGEYRLDGEPGSGASPVAQPLKDFVGACQQWSADPATE